MFRYYSLTEKSKWELIVDSPAALESLIAKECAMVGMLSVSNQVTDETDHEKLTYKGALYFDIDNEGNLTASISALHDLLFKLKEQGVDRQDIKVWASGKKGFHITVSEKVFSTGRAIKYLPYIYKEMALELFVDGLDMVVYSAKKGRMWRQENVRRSDNGKYKVGLLPNEVADITDETYPEFTNKSRNIKQLGNNKPAERLSVLFEVCKKRVAIHQKQRTKDISSQVSDEVLAEFREELPGCIQKMCEEGATEGLSNFNQMAMQFGIFIARSGMSRKVWEPIVSDMSQKLKSGTYKSKRDKYNHITGMIRYACVTTSMIFSRGALFSVIEPCGNCPICQTKSGNDIAVTEDNLAGITERDNGYYISSGEGARRITTYTIQPENFYTAKAQDTEMTRRVGIEASIEVNGKQVASVRIDESAWDSKGALIRELRGISNLAFLGGDPEVQRLKHYLFTRGFDMGEIQQVFSAGIHRHKIGKATTLVYVEPGFSVNAQKERGTHHVDGRVPAPPRVSEQEFPKEGDEKFKLVIQALLRVNKPHIVGQILGWFSACHLKVHIQSSENQFPILNLWGNAESGKTTTACLFSCLNGCDYIMEDSPVSLGGATPWAVAKFAASTTTAPRLLDEFNKSKIKEYNYNYFSEVMKAAWNNQTFSRGSISAASKVDGKGQSGGVVADFKITGPLVVMSEQSPEAPALQQRMVQVSLSTKSRIGCDDDFYTAMENREYLWKLSRAMVWRSLETLPNWTKKKMSDYKRAIPKKIKARTNYSYRVVLTGLDFFTLVTKELGLELGLEIKELKKQVLDHLKVEEDHISRAKSKTEIDSVMASINLMAGMEENHTSKNYLVAGIHYIWDGEKLYLDATMAHALYRRFIRMQGEKAVISSLEQFKVLLKQENYYLRSEAVELISSSRNMEVLDIELMKKKGLDVSSFKSAIGGI